MDIDYENQALYEALRWITAIFFYPLVAVIGCIGCVIIILTLRCESMRTSTNCYLTALAVADLIKLANDFLYFPATLLQWISFSQTCVVFAHLYPYAFFLNQYSAGCANWLTLAVAMERYLLVTKPNWSRINLSTGRAKLFSLIIYMAVLVISLPMLVRYDTLETQQSSECSDSNCSVSSNCSWFVQITSYTQKSLVFRGYMRFHACVRSLIPLLLLAYLVVRIIIVLRHTRANKRLRQRNRVTLMLSVLVMCFVLLTMPDTVLTTMGWGYNEAKFYYQKAIREVSDLLLMINSAINFFLYITFNKVFRQTLASLLGISPTVRNVDDQCNNTPLQCAQFNGNNNNDCRLISSCNNNIGNVDSCSNHLAVRNDDDGSLSITRTQSCPEKSCFLSGNGHC